MEDIFGAPGDFGMNLGMGPGVIAGDNNEFGGGNSGPSFEEKFRENNTGYNNNDRDRDYKDNYKKRDSLESKFAERPDFGDRFTANRNKTHPSNRGRGGRGGGPEIERRTSPQYESSS